MSWRLLALTHRPPLDSKAGAETRLYCSEYGAGYKTRAHPPPSRLGGMADHDACITLLMSRGIGLWIDPCVMVWDRKRWAGAQSDVVVRRGGRYGGRIGARLGKGAGVGVHQTF